MTFGSCYLLYSMLSIHFLPNTCRQAGFNAYRTYCDGRAHVPLGRWCVDPACSPSCHPPMGGDTKPPRAGQPSPPVAPWRSVQHAMGGRRPRHLPAWHLPGAWRWFCSMVAAALAWQLHLSSCRGRSFAAPAGGHGRAASRQLPRPRRNAESARGPEASDGASGGWRRQRRPCMAADAIEPNGSAPEPRRGPSPSIQGGSQDIPRRLGRCGGRCSNRLCCTWALVVDSASFDLLTRTIWLV